VSGCDASAVLVELACSRSTDCSSGDSRCRADLPRRPSFHHLLAKSSEELTGPLQRITLRLVAILLGLFTGNVVFEPQNLMIGTRQFSVFVDVPCAGWEGIGLFSTFFTIYLWIYRRELRFPQVLVLLPIGALIVWLSNALRLILLILLGSLSASAAIEGFHSVAGWLFFDAVTVTLVVVSRQLSLFAKASPAGDTRNAATPNPAAPYLVPLVLIIATSTITCLFSSGFDPLYPLRFAIGGAALCFYRNRISLQWKVSWWTVVLGILGFAVWLALPQGDWNVSTEGAFSLGLGKLPSWAQFLWLFCRALAAIVVIPIAEELAFRGYLLRKLVRANFETVPLGYFTWFSFLTCSILFGVLHARWLAGCFAGMIFAAAVYRRGLLSDGILSHGITNGLLAAYVLATGRWSLWN
jgi:exosortase E/protease (VPEID-CTERM system)